MKKKKDFTVGVSIPHIIGSFEEAAQGAAGLQAGSVFRVTRYAVVLTCWESSKAVDENFLPYKIKLIALPRFSSVALEKLHSVLHLGQEEGRSTE